MSNEIKWGSNLGFTMSKFQLELLERDISALGDGVAPNGEYVSEDARNRATDLHQILMDFHEDQFEEPDGDAQVTVILRRSDWNFLGEYLELKYEEAEPPSGYQGEDVDRGTEYESGLESRLMSWEEEGELFNELQWFTSNPDNGASARDRQLAHELSERHIADTHPEPDGLGEYDASIYYLLTEEVINSLEERLATVQVTWPKEDWELADRLLNRKYGKEVGS